MSRAYSPAQAMYPPPGYQSGRNTPQSMSGGNLYQPTPSRPATNYLDVQIPGTRSPEEYDLPSGMPTDVDIERAVQAILRDADLTTVTKREIRQRLEESFGMDLTARKRSINAAIDRVLLARSS